MSKHDNNNQSNDTRSSQGETAGVEAFAASLQSDCYSSQSPTDVTLNTTITTININSNLEDIPVLSVMTTNLVCVTKPDIFNKPQDFIDPVSGLTLQQSLLENFLSPNASTHNMRIMGDATSWFKFTLKDITNNKVWDWSVYSSNSNYPNDAQWRNSFWDSAHENPFMYGGMNYIPVEFPAVSVDTTYHAYFTPTTTGYLDHLPTQASPWVINQLVDITMTANFLDGQLLGTSGATDLICDKGVDDTYTTTAGGIFPTLGNNGVWDVDITFSIDQEVGRLVWNADRLGVPNGIGGANDDVVTIDNIQLPATGVLPEILSIDCIASIVAESGNPKSARILGTITFGDIGIVDQDIIFPASEFFTIE